jgi:hypothetical protein
MIQPPPRDPRTRYNDAIRRLQRHAIDRIEAANNSARTLPRLRAEITAALEELEELTNEAEARYRKALRSRN